MALLSFKWLVPVILHLLHPFYVSVTEINHNAKEHSLEISCKIFAEDMEETLKKNYHVSVDLASEKQKAQVNQMITDYLTKHLTINSDGSNLKLQYIGFEKQSEAVYCYFEVSNINSVKKLSVTDSILQDFTDREINIIHATVNGNRKSTKLDYPNTAATFSW